MNREFTLDAWRSSRAATADSHAVPGCATMKHAVRL